VKKYDDLLVFVTVVDRQSFIGAARQLNLPPGTVSRKVQELETRLGITLLNRTTRRLSVTEVGREVYDAASRGDRGSGIARDGASRQARGRAAHRRALCAALHGAAAAYAGVPQDIP
jgi:DNA-binding transcriptional LysR family regulator